jgi:signal transduction histidine kinase
MKFVPKSIAGRLALSAAVMIGIALVISAIGIGLVLERFIRSQIDQRLDAQITSISSALVAEGGTLKLVANVDSAPFDRFNSGWYWQVTTATQTLRSASLVSQSLAPPAERRNMRQMPGDGLFTGEGRGPRHQDLHFVSRSVSVGGVDALILVTAPQNALLTPMFEALWPLGASLIVLGLSLAAASIAQVRVGLRPLSALKARLEDVRNGNATHIPPDQPTELMPLVGELNTLIDQNAEGLARARSHVANLGHALNTPLATLELSLRDDKKPSDKRIALVREMQERIRHHLGRARTAVLSGPARASSPIAPHVADISAALGKIYADKNLKFKSRIAAGTTVACEPQDLDEMLGNILDNAFKWANSKVEITAASSEGNVTLSLEDDGPGLADDKLPEALLPGRRLDEATPGSGFGLSITRELAELYGGSITLSRAEMGGLRVVLVLPGSALPSPRILRGEGGREAAG